MKSSLFKVQIASFSTFVLPDVFPCGITVGATVAKTVLAAWLLSRAEKIQIRAKKLSLNKHVRGVGGCVSVPVEKELNVAL